MTVLIEAEEPKVRITKTESEEGRWKVSGTVEFEIFELHAVSEGGRTTRLGVCDYRFRGRRKRNRTRSGLRLRSSNRSQVP